MQVPADSSAAHVSAAAVRDTLRQLTANLLRIMRGTGRPEEVLQQAQAFIACCAAHQEIAGCEPSGMDVAEALRLGLEAGDDGDAESADAGGSWGEWDRAVREMIHGGLQVAAAELLGQHAQASVGRRELFSGYRDIEKIHSRQLSRLLRRGAS